MKACYEASKGTAYGVCFSQFLLMFGVVLYSPPVEVYTYKAQVFTVNETLYCSDLNKSTFDMSVPFLLSSAIIIIFCTNTMSMAEKGLSEYEYGEQVVDEAAVWNSSFCLYIYVSHMLLCVLTSSPGDVFQVFMAGVFMSFFLIRACEPKEGTTFVKENTNLLGYALGVGLVWVSCSVPKRLYFFAAFVVIDYFLGVGHLWECPVMLNTVMNCRMCYVCASSMGLAFIYATWNHS